MWLGINPGLGGCAALLGADGAVELWPTPTVPTGKGARRAYDRAGLRGLAGGWAVRRGRVTVVVEQQHAALGAGSIGAWLSGHGYGLWLATLEATGLRPVHEVHPARWKRALGAVPPSDLPGLPPRAAAPRPDPELLAAWQAARPPVEAGVRAQARWKRARPKASPGEEAAYKASRKATRDARRGAGLALMCARAAELFPQVDLRATPRSKAPDHNRAAALLLAVYARDYLEVPDGR